VNPKRVRRLMRLMGLEAIYPKPRLSQSTQEHKRYPYLLRDVVIDRPDQVWCADITYIRMLCGFVYLVAIMDWFSRYVLAWEISTALDTGFCVRALGRALSFSKPDIFNTDQGFNSPVWSLPGAFKGQRFGSVWMAVAGFTITSLWNGSGERSNMKRFISTIIRWSLRFDKGYQGIFRSIIGRGCIPR